MKASFLSGLALAAAAAAGVGFLAGFMIVAGVLIILAAFINEAALSAARIDMGEAMSVDGRDLAALFIAKESDHG